MKTLEPLIAEHPFFQGLEPRFLELVSGCAANVRYEPGRYLFREGDASNKFYVIREGCVALEIAAPGRGKVTIETRTAGDIVSWSWLIPPYQHHFSAHVMERTRAFEFDAACLRRKSEEDHDFGYEMLKRFSTLIVQSMQATRLQLLDVYKE